MPEKTLGEKTKVSCDCGFKGNMAQMLTAVSPFDENEIVAACPECKELNGTIFTVCDEPNCWEPDTCGFKTQKSYRRTCSTHKEKECTSNSP